MNYFSSPQNAVEVINRLLGNEDWQTLSSYYDLGQNEYIPAELLSGSYFHSAEEQDVVHPAFFGGIIRPFPPGFGYDRSEESEEGIIKVWVKIEIPEGGGMIQVGFHSFMLVRKEKGLQLVYAEE